MKQNFRAVLEFVRSKGVVGLAVAVILGAALTALVKAIVDGLLDPLIGLVLPNTDNLERASFQIADSEFKWGQVASALIDFVAIAAVLYYLLRWLRLDKLDKGQSGDAKDLVEKL